MLKWFCIATLLALTACADHGRMDHGTGTQVELTHSNYRVIKAGAEGTSSGFWFLFIPISSPSYADAKADLYQNAGVKLQGKPVALANETEDHSFFTLLLFSVPRVKITADIVEFNSPTASAGSSAAPAKLPQHVSSTPLPQ